MGTKPVIIIGAGPAGIGAALSLGDDATVLERGNQPGGLARTEVIDGAIFDFGGHSFHTPHPEVRDLVYGAVDMYEQQRDARCYVAGEFIPYPFQKNFRQLSSKGVVDECAEGLMRAGDTPTAQNFEEFILARFGPGISKHFMLPYNRKIWGRDLRRLAADWTGERVAAPEGVAEKFETAGGKRKALQGDTKVAYPAKGGFGEIYRALAERIHDLRYGQEIVRINPVERTVTMSDSSRYGWQRLVSTMPLPVLISRIENAPARLRELASQLDCLALKVGLVVVGHPVDTEIQRVYSADLQIPAHKTAVNHNSSDWLRALPHHGIMTEISVGPAKTLPRADIDVWVVDSLLELGLIQDPAEVRHVEIRNVPFAYPVPTIGRDGIVSEIQDWLREYGIDTLGRFGQWAYINSDESIYRGMLVGNRIAGEIGV